MLGDGRPEGAPYDVSALPGRLLKTGQPECKMQNAKCRMQNAECKDEAIERSCRLHFDFAFCLLPFAFCILNYRERVLAAA
jgi:hypothetical protein